MADPKTGEPPAGSRSERPTAALSKFDRDTAVWRVGDPDRLAARGADEDALRRAADGGRAQQAGETLFAAEVAPDWRAGRGPHGGYLAAMLLRALIESVADPARDPRSLTIHYARAPEPGPVAITTTLEREGRSLSTLSARMHQGERLIALVLGAFSLPWSGPEISEVKAPDVPPPDPSREGLKLVEHGPEFAHHIVLQPRIEGRPFSGVEQPMAIRGWMGLVEPRAIDALSLAFFSDALIPAPYMRMREWSAVPTVDLTVHFRARMRPEPDADPHELCLAQTTSELVHDGFFVEDGTIWAADGTLLAQSRQLAIVVPFHPPR
ncbi:MAG TPA: thioesterase family protein [Solirubrobacteraceae bacterium]|nr:thioesterase family protein [Solirubrobacteraceae bacterium]